MRVASLSGWLARRGPSGPAAGAQERRRTSAELALEKLSRAIEQTADSVVITDRDGVIEYVNPAFERMTGFRHDEVVGRTPRLLRSGVHARAFYESLWSTILAGRTFRSIMTNRKRDGHLYDEDQTITPIRDGEGAITHFVSTGRDITQRRRTQEALRRLNQQLESQAARLAGVLHDEAGQFLTAAHITLAEVTREAGPELRERLHEVRRHLDQIEERLRQISHETHPRVVEELGLGEAVSFFVDSFGRRTGIAAVLESSLPGRYPLPVETLLYRVVQEALTNVAHHARATRVTVALSGDDRSAGCAIRDDGVGFDPGAFVPGGRGLGLGLMRDRLEAVGGSLTITAAPGRGSEVRASVPVEA